MSVSETSSNALYSVIRFSLIAFMYSAALELVALTSIEAVEVAALSRRHCASAAIKGIYMFFSCYVVFI